MKFTTGISKDLHTAKMFDITRNTKKLMKDDVFRIVVVSGGKGKKNGSDKILVKDGTELL